MSLVYAPRYGLLSSLPNAVIPIIFGESTIRIIMHDGRPDSFELRLSHPFSTTGPSIWLLHPSIANCVTTIDPPYDATDSVVRAPYARSSKIVTVELLHNRLGQRHSCRQRSRRLGGRHCPLRTLILLY